MVKQKSDVGHPCRVALMSVGENLFVLGGKFIVSIGLRSYSCRVVNSLIGWSPIGWFEFAIWFWKSNGNIFCEIHMVNVDELNRFVEWFDSEFRRHVILILRLLMKSIIHYFLRPHVYLFNHESILWYLLDLFWKALMHHEIIYWNLYLSHTWTYWDFYLTPSYSSISGLKP
jgi:hypothetical protein